MLVLSTKPNKVTQLNIALHLLKHSVINAKKIIPLIEIIPVEKITWEYRLQISSLLFKHGQIGKAKELISGIDQVSERDFVTTLYLMNHIEMLSCCGKSNYAFSMIPKAYHENTNIKDSYAKFAWYYYHKKGDYQKSLKVMLKDYTLKRISSTWLIKLATEYAFNCEPDKAFTIIKNAYKSDPDLKDGYSEIAKLLYIPQMKYEEALIWFSYDDRDRRLSEKNKLLYAQLLFAFHHEKKVGTLLKNYESHEILYHKALGARLGKRFAESFKLFEKLHINEKSSTALKEEYVLALLLCDKYSMAESVVLQYKLQSSKIAFKRHRWYIQSRIGKPDYAMLCKLCENDLVLGHNYFYSWMRLQICKIHSGDGIGAKEILKKSSVEFPEYKIDFEATHILWSSIVNIGNKNNYNTGFLENINLNSLDCFKLFNLSIAMLLSERFDQVDKIMNRMYSLNSSFFLIKTVQGLNNIYFLSIILHHYGLTPLTDQCIEFAKKNSPVYLYLTPFINNVRKTKAMCCFWDFPEFELPWAKYHH